MTLFCSETSQKNLVNILTDIRIYFDQALGTILLYRFERLQYRNILERINSGELPKEFSRIYGAQHLLRLFRNL